MACRNELGVEKLLFWITGLPSDGKPRRSSNFRLMGSEWYFLFSYRRNNCYHVLSLHRVTDGSKQLKFKTNTFIAKPILAHDGKEVAQQQMTVQNKDTDLWYSRDGSTGYIYNYLPSLYEKGEVKFVCRFYDQPPSVVQLQLGRDRSVTSDIALTDLDCLSNDLGRLLEDKQLLDVRINCGGQSFPVHRAILAARSEVFAAMFRNKMAESLTGEVDLKDTDPDGMRQFLQYVYCGKMTAGSGNEVANLYSMADKYAVDSLKKACTRWIISGLTEGDCVDQLTTDGEKLKKEAIQCVCAHPEIMVSQEWVELSGKNPELAVEVYQIFIKSKVKA